ncbi:16S rRNA (guanine(527)-N(7))-methyltransferase RsmG [Aliiroseovarius subalbicans]|uniref:16S rRNA (guanine(527)-N(7))-methyltransferase RsmG n=1 Tax=Aliiroseovarius subalbicans TaxID=2925840 RepID=UPI001F59203D|nr:16S rRNA (guanine(527)-N(7))-methyltransferase RsmG [Aliiroseovarius subalbicans]MCI2400064.1 16S rRNA (guanine(527)-N(7))-methyltransferase RsmG [Aliiroseovarius subalbicans]
MSNAREQVLQQLSVSRETTERLDAYASLLEKWNPAINLVAPSTIKDLWTRHFLDSAQVLDLAPPGETWMDIGTGGGFPGLIVAVLASEMRPELKMTCVESDQRKATFLRTAARELGLAVDIQSKRIEDLVPAQADILSARALAPLVRLLDFAEHHLAPNGRAIFLKGANHQREMQEALEKWQFQADTYPSKTDPDAVILSLGGIRRA